MAQDPALFINADFPTAQSVANLAMDPRGPQGLIVAPQARLLDLNLQPMSLPVPLDEHDPTALCSLNNSGYIKDLTVEGNVTDDIHHKASFRLYEFPGMRSFNTLRSLVAVSAQYFYIEDDKPRLVNEVPIGIYLFSIPDRTLLDSGNFWDITAHGQTQLVADLGFENNFTIPANADIVQTVKAMLMADKLPPDEGGRHSLNSCGTAAGCVGCPEPSGTGTGSGYCQQGYALTDPLALALPYGSSTQLRQRGADGFSTTVIYNAGIGMKIDSETGAPIDPFSCQPMVVQTVTPLHSHSAVPGEIILGEMVLGEDVGPTSFPAFILSQLDTAGNQMYLDTATGKCYDVLSGDEVDPISGDPANVLAPILFTLKVDGFAGTGGGDGGTGVSQGNGKGYSPSFGWAVNDTAHALTVQTAPGSSTYLHFVPEAGGNVQYLYTPNVTGLKIEAVTGHPVDPWSGQPMAYASDQPGQPQSSWAGQLFRCWEPYHSWTLHQIMYLDTKSMKFYTWDGVQSAGHLTQVFPTWLSVTPTPPETVFQLAGGDGGVSTIPPGAVGPQSFPVGAYGWPDANNPGLTPSCCPHSGPDIPAYRIHALPSSQDAIDSDTGKPVTGPPRTRDTLPFSPKDNQLKSLNNLLSAGNYWPLYDDPLGNFVLSPMPYVDGTVPSPNPYFHYETGEQGVIYPGISQKLDATTVANKVVVRSENTKRAAISAVAYNRSNGSYISVQNLGRVIQKQPTIYLDTITDPLVLKLRAFIEVNLAALPAESIVLEVFLNPFLGVHDVVGLNVFSKDGKTLEISTNANPFLITSWKTDFSTRRTSYTMGRLVPL